jgi:hypothetical protein
MMLQSLLNINRANTISYVLKHYVRTSLEAYKGYFCNLIKPANCNNKCGKPFLCVNSKVRGKWQFWLMFVGVQVESGHRRQIRLIESNSKCRYLKNFLPVKGLCGRYVICLRPKFINV